MVSTLLLVLAPAPLPAREAVSGQTKWDLGLFSWVQRVRTEPGAPANDHPVTLGEEALGAALAPVKAKVEGKFVPLFSKGEVKDLAKALSEAFALAQPGEDLILLATSRHGAGFMEPAEGVTARLFVRGGILNVIVHDARMEFMGRYLGDNLQPKFTYGLRATASAEQLQAPQATARRGDWLCFPLDAAPLVAAPAPVAAVVPVTAPASAPAPAATPEPAKARDAAFYEAQTLRLKALKRLRDENLLSEAEYQEKRQAILKTL
jgi:hypothetical protein